jgi:hypothetical protein
MVATCRVVAVSFLVLVGVLHALASPAFAQAPAAVEGPVQIPVHRARMLALDKLRSPRCRSLFAEFEDLEGRPLDRVLTDAEETAEARLSRLSFRDGARTLTCARPGVYAFTSPGSLTVYVCPSFCLLSSQEVKTAANILIHEELHSLGAGEAPMPGLLTAMEITRRVEDRCGR